VLPLTTSFECHASACPSRLKTTCYSHSPHARASEPLPVVLLALFQLGPRR
jgi:hypothetical protein